MAYIKRVLLCGHSLFIASLRSSLGTVPRLDLQQVDTQPDHIRDRIFTWKPDVLILETELLKNDFSLSLLPDFPI